MIGVITAQLFQDQSVELGPIALQVERAEIFFVSAQHGSGLPLAHGLSGGVGDDLDVSRPGHLLAQFALGLFGRLPLHPVLNVDILPQIFACFHSRFSFQLLK